MGKEKFTIPMPDEHIIHAQIEQIVASGVRQKQTFPSYLKSMIQQVSIRQLFADRMELGLVLLAAVALLSVLLIMPPQAPLQDLYAAVFLISPIVFLAFSIYTYVNKIERDTYEVEMACKYNVYQIIAFRMLAFSVVSILVNTIAIVLLVSVYEDIQFIRALMISITSLFVFSILFLYALMRRRSKVILIATVIGWTFGNLLLHYVDNKLYNDLLVNMPLFVYAIVLIGSLYVYMNNVKRLIHFNQTKGAF